MLFFAAGQFDRVEQHAAQGLSRWQAHLLAIFLCRRLSARRWACAKIRQRWHAQKSDKRRAAPRPALRPPGPSTAPTWPQHRATCTAPRAQPCAHPAPAPRPASRPPAPRPALPAPLASSTTPAKNSAVTQTPGTRHGNHVPYPASRDIPRQCLAYTQLLRLCSCRTCTHPFIKQLPLYALRQDVTRAELFGTPWACPCSGVPTGEDFQSI